MPTISVPCPVCPRCERPVSMDDWSKRIGPDLWHERCHEKYKRDREWLSEVETQGGVG